MQLTYSNHCTRQKLGNCWIGACWILMLERLSWTTNGWDDYLFWQNQDKRMLRRINQLIESCLPNPSSGIGKPERLRENLSGCWSRRIDACHRLVYRVDAHSLVILACRYHYGD